MAQIADFLGRGWKFPIATTEKNISISAGLESIRESIMLILGTAKGERIMRPDFGCDINSLVFEVNNTATTTLITFHVEESLRKWEPRIKVLGVYVRTDQEERNKLYINIEYEVKTMNTKDNLVYPFYLEGKV